MRMILIAAVSTTLLIGANTAMAAWGAIELNSEQQPKQPWVSKFHSTPDVVAVGSIPDAIEQCDEIVGINRFCVVEIGYNSLLEPFTITRSRTKIIGVDDMQPLPSVSGGATISIGDGITHVALQNLDLEGHDAGDEDVYGIILYGESIKQVLIEGNHIHDFNSSANAHAIGVFGTGADGITANTGIVIRNNDIRNMQTGSSESIVVNGNVANWVIDLNYIEDINNIGIDAIGGEGVSPTQIIDGKVYPGKFDVARRGWITNNTVSNMSTVNNPAYGNVESWASAIYVDGGARIHIEGNTVENAPWAYTIGAENCTSTRNVTLIWNTAIGSYYGDILIGGYSEVGYKASDADFSCDPHESIDANEGHGYASRVTVEGNELSSPNATIASIQMQYRARGVLMYQEGILDENAQGNGGARGDQNAIRTQREY